MPELKKIKTETGFLYNRDAVRERMFSVIESILSNDTLNWLKEKAEAVDHKNDIQSLMIAFAATPRKTGKAIITVSDSIMHEIQNLREGLSLSQWNIDRLCRVWLLVHLNTQDKLNYIRVIENLFFTAEMNEQVALYSSLPLLAYPEVWKARCAEGIRSNIGLVLESIMYDNPYPGENLDEPAWNQLVLKAIFTEKDIHRIVHLDKRANQKLANTLSDYAHERWAAQRPVYPLLWRCVAHFVNETIFSDIARISVSSNEIEREAAALVCDQSTYPPAKKLLKDNPELKKIIDRGISWKEIGKRLEAVS